MGINIGRYNFEGPYSSTANLKNQSGVYAILGNSGGNRTVIDIGESGWVKERVENHDRKPCWRGRSSNLEVAALYKPEGERMRIEKELRTQYDPPCGKQ